MDAKAEKAEGGFAENVARNAEGGGDDEVAEGVGQKMAERLTQLLSKPSKDLN